MSIKKFIKRNLGVVILSIFIINITGCGLVNAIKEGQHQAELDAIKRDEWFKSMKSKNNSGMDEDHYDLSQLDGINSRFKFLVSLTKMLDLYKDCTPIAIEMIKNIDDMDKYFHNIQYPNYDMDTVAMYKKNVIGLSNELFETAIQIKEGLIKKNKFDKEKKEKHEKESKVLDDLSVQTYRFYQEYVTGMY